MKKSLFYIAAAAFTLVSCNEEELVQVPTNQVNGVLTVAFEQDGATRTHITSTTSENKTSNILAWSADDEIAVFGETAVKYTISEVNNGTFQVAEDATAPTEITGVAFPYSEDVSLSESTLTMTLPSEIDQTTAGELDLPMWATVSDDNITLKHLAGVLKVNLADVPAGYKTLTVTADKPICGSFSANLKVEDGEYPVLASVSAANGNTVTVNFTESSSPILYLPLPVGEYNSIVVSVSGEGKGTKVLKQWTTTRNVARAQVYSTTVSDYTSIMNEEELVAAVAKGGEVTLGANITIDESISIEETNSVTVNLNGKTLTLNEKIVNAGSLTLKDGNIVADGTVVRSNSGSLTMTDCQVTGGQTVVYVTGGTAEITGGSYNNSNSVDDNTSAYCIAVDGENTTAAINTTVNKDVTEGVYKGGVTVRYSATVNITGGEYYGNQSRSQHGLHAAVGAKVTYDEDVKFNDFYVQAIGSSGNTLAASKVNGATFGSTNFTGSKAEMDAEIAKIELVTAITAGGTVTLGADVTLDESISIAEGNTVTVNLNGKTLTLNEKIVNAGSLTLKDGNIVADGTAVKSNSGSLTMTDCQVTGGQTVVYVTGGTAEITGGSYNNSNSVDDNTSAYCIAVDGENTTATINTTVNKDVTEGVYKGGVTVRYSATVNITGGEYYGNQSRSQHGLHAAVGAKVTYAEDVKFNDFYVQAIGSNGNALAASEVNEASFGSTNFTGNKEQMDAKIAAILAAEE